MGKALYRERGNTGATMPGPSPLSDQSRLLCLSRHPFFVHGIVCVCGGGDMEALAEEAIGLAGQQRITAKEEGEGMQDLGRGTGLVAREHHNPTSPPSLVSPVPLLRPRTPICSPLSLCLLTVNTQVFMHTPNMPDTQ